MSCVQREGVKARYSYGGAKVEEKGPRYSGLMEHSEKGDHGAAR